MGRDDESDESRETVPEGPRRAVPRYSVRAEVELRCGSWPSFRPVRTRNASLKGLLALVDGTPPVVGEAAVLRFQSRSGEPVEVGVVVVRVDPDDGEGRGAAVALGLAGPDGSSLADLLPGSEGGRASEVRETKPARRWTAAPAERADLAEGAALGMPEADAGGGTPDMMDREAEVVGSDLISDIDIDALVGLTSREQAIARDSAAPACGSPERADAWSSAGVARPEAARPSRPDEDLRETPVPPGGEDPRETPVPPGDQDLRETPVPPKSDDLRETPLPPGGEDARSTPVPPAGDVGSRAAGAEGAAWARSARSGEGGPIYSAEQVARAAATVAAAKPAPREGVRQIESRTAAGTAAPAVLRRVVPIIGIDLGTTYSKVAVVDGGEVVLLEDEDAKASTRAAVPSAVAYERDGTCLVGEAARELLATSPSQVIISAKRVMGLRYSDPLSGGLLGSLACTSFAGPNDSILFDVRGHKITVPEASARILEHLLRMARKYAGTRIEKAVLTMPVDFDFLARRELELAARMAGIDIAALVLEPVAAAMGCGYDGRASGTVAVFDFGGGTLDTSIVDVGEGRFTVRGAAGDRWLGGDDFDEVLARHVADEFQAQSGIALQGRVEEWQRLVFDCEEAKRWLSTLESVDVILPKAALTPSGPVTLLVPVTRTDFEEVAADIVSSATEVCRQATEQAGIDPHSVDALLVTGGTTRIPVVRNAAEQFFGRKAVSGIHPEHAVVIGAAVQGAVLSGGGLPREFVERLRGRGSAGSTIGLALAGGTTEQIIDASQRPPVAAHRRYSTSRDGQTTIRIEIVEGTSKLTGQNRRVGGFVIDGLPEGKAGDTTIDVYFELASTATLNVTALERSTGRRAQGRFDLSS